MSKLRQNIVTGEWVVISPERSKRPEDYVSASSPKRGIPKDCPFCVANNVAYPNSIKEAETDNIYVIPNKFPAFTKSEALIDEGDNFYQNTTSLGGHEVIVIKNHEQDVYNDGRDILNELIGVYKKRYQFYNQDPAIAYTMLIHNHGPEAAASIEHPHSQLFASAILPSYVEKEIDGSKKYYTHEGKCVFCKMIESEKGNNHRIIYENDEFLCFTFFAARFPFEIWIMPKNHQPHFEEINSGTQAMLADAMHQAISKLNRSLNFPPFNYWIHSLPHYHSDGNDHYHWHMEIAPRVSKFGGYEMGSGVVIDVVSPEVAAAFLRKA